MRLDQWLWAVRVYKTRTISAEAIKGGHVRVNDLPVKPSREVRADDLVTAVFGPMTRTLKVISSPVSRVAAKLVPNFALELTTEEEFAKRRPEPNLLPPGFRLKGFGRPTKRQRREIDGVSDEAPEEPGGGS
ncbi:MAG TPA: RNA-binding S4 domain-containing protein [Chthoniobacteraceae bacterium]